jgi:nucleoside-diphosphate-sugar epimerase
MIGEHLPPHRVLVTGAAGKIGRATTLDLRSRGVEVIELSTSFPNEPLAAGQVIGDATVADDVAGAMTSVDAVVHLAAIAHPDHAVPYDVYRTNVTSTFNVLEQAARAGVTRAVIASSINAFGVPMNHHGVLPAYLPIDEDIPIALDDWYSLSKRSDELTAQMAASRWGIDVIAFRFPLVASHGDLAAYAIELAKSPQGAAREGWSYLTLDDATRAIWAALCSTARGAHVLNLSAEDTLLTMPTLELTARYLAAVPIRKPVPGRAPLVDGSRARDLLGFEPRQSIHAPSNVGEERHADHLR